MPEINVPSIWDYLGQGIQNFQQAQELERQKRVQELGIASQLFGQGALTAADLTPIAQPVLPNVKIQPNKIERQQKAIKTAPPSEQGALERASVDLPSSGTLAQENLAGQKAQLSTDYLSGKPLTEEQAAVLGLPTAQELAIGKATKVDPILQQAGSQYVDAEILKLGGRLTPGQAMQIADRAYQQYQADYQKNGLGILTKEQLADAKRYFASRAMEALTEQRKLDIANLSAQNQHDRINPQDRMFAAITNIIESNRRTMADITAKNPVIGNYVDMDPSKVPELFRGQVARLKYLQDREKQLVAAQGMLAANVMPKNIASLIGDQAQVGQIPPSGGGNVDLSADPIVATTKQLLSSGKITEENVRTSKKLTQAQKDAVLGKK